MTGVQTCALPIYGRVKEHLGGINEFLAYLKTDNLKEIERSAATSKPAAVAQEAAPAEKATGKQLFEQQKQNERERRKVMNQIKNVEKKIAELEAEIAQIEEKLANPAPGEDLIALSEKYSDLKKELDKNMEEWMSFEAI